MADHPHIQLGRHSLPVYEQPWPRVVKRLGGLIDGLRDGADELDPKDLVESLKVGGRLYEALITFVPALPKFLPEHEFNGYASPEAWRNGEYDEDADMNADGKGGIAPTFTQFLDAFETIIEVHGGKRFLALLTKAFDPQMLKAEASLALSEWRERASTGLPSLPTTSTESAQNASTTTDPTSERGTGSMSEVEHLDFVPRSEPEFALSGSPRLN